MAERIKAARFQIVHVDGDHIEAFQRWSHLADSCKQIVNFIWQRWELWHVQNDTADKLQEYLDRKQQYDAAPKKQKPFERPKQPVQAMPPELSKVIRDGLSKRFPHVHGRVRDLIQNKVTKTIKSRKAARGKLPGWMSILFLHERPSSSVKPQPIPFDKKNCPAPEAPQSENGNYKLRFRLQAIPQEGKNSIGVCDTVELMSRGKKVSGQATILKRICSGEYDFKGSALVREGRKWYAIIHYEMPPRENLDVDPNRVAVLRPCEKRPWKLRVPKRNFHPGGNGKAVETKRRKLLKKRSERKFNYRQSGSANRGHGRKRAIEPWTQYTADWKDFVRSHNNTTTANVVEAAEQFRCGKIVYIQPVGDYRDSRFLANAGQNGQYRDKTGWDWHQVLSQLRQKTEGLGIEVEVRKRGSQTAG